MNNLNWEVFVTPGMPTVTRDRPVGVPETFFQATASTLIYGDKDAVLVDAYMTTKRAGRAWKPGFTLQVSGSPSCGCNCGCTLLHIGNVSSICK